MRRCRCNQVFWWNLAFWGIVLPCALKAQEGRLQSLPLKPSRVDPRSPFTKTAPYLSQNTSKAQQDSNKTYVKQRKNDLNAKAAQAVDKASFQKKTEQELWQLVSLSANGLDGQNAAEELARRAAHDRTQGVSIFDRLLLIPRFQMGSQAKEFRRIRRELLFQKISQIPSWQERAQRYKIFAEQEKGELLAKRALFRSARAAEEGGDLRAAHDTYRGYLLSYPHSDDRLYIFGEMLRISMRAFQLQAARGYLKQLLAIDSDPENQEQWQYELCRLDIALALDEAPKSCSNKYLLKSAGKTLQWRLIEAMNRHKKVDDKVAFIENTFLKRDDLSLNERLKALALLLEEEILGAERKETYRQEIFQIYTEFNKTLNAEARRILARLAYQSINSPLTLFRSRFIRAEQADTFIASLQDEKAAYDELLGLYQRILKIEDPVWGTIALYELAQANQHFALQLTQLAPIQGIEMSRLSTDLNSQAAVLLAKAKVDAANAEKNISRFDVLHPVNRLIINYNKNLKNQELRFDDIFPNPEWISHEP